MNGIIIFAVLLALMLTGMPVSISLGLTVLTFIFGFTQVPLESVALKLFTDRKSTRLNSSHIQKSRMPSSA